MQLKHRLVAARIRNNLPCERGDGKNPKLKKSRNQVLGLDLPRLTSSSTAFTSRRSPSCKTSCDAAQGGQVGEFDLKALLLPAVNVDPGCVQS